MLYINKYGHLKTMWNMVSLLLLVVFFISTSCSRQLHPLSDEFIARTNKEATTWRAEKQFNIEDWEYVKAIANGVTKDSLKLNSLPFAVNKRSRNLNEDDLPEYFDSAEKWPKCESIREIRDQGKCASAWAFAVVEATSDRICIFSNGTLQTRVSAQDLIACSTRNSGCQGGDPTYAWLYWIDTGIVTGGLYGNSDQGCLSYSIPECDDHPQNCLYNTTTPKCLKKCDNTSVDYEKSRTFGDTLTILEAYTQIQDEIMQYGPVETTMTVYDEFLNYRNGIYQPTHRALAIGTHAAKIVGWGIENGTKYWKVANSWNSRWGENGYFRIVRGINSCRIEEFAYGGFPKL